MEMSKVEEMEWKRELLEEFRGLREGLREVAKEIDESGGEGAKRKTRGERW